MIYTPEKNPRQAFILITLIVLFGIVWGYWVNEFYMTVALLFWMQYTAVLSYLQFKRKTRHKYKTFTEILLYPQLRFFIFELIAFWGVAMLIMYKTLAIGTAALLAWWLFSLNFYLYYRKKKK